jgi:putative membrane protein
MTTSAAPDRLPQTLRLAPRDAAVYAAIGAVGAILSHLAHHYPADMPAVGPYEFSWAIWLAVTLSAFWYARGLARLDRADWPALWRRVAFVAGLALVYAVTQTQFEYLAQRMFFLNRIQHVSMHHLGPVLLALSTAGPVILAGGPDWLRRLCSSRPARRAMHAIQQPALAALLFVGLFYLWLVPSVHFVAMLDPVLYQVMNWTMVLDGILFWALVLDTRPAPPARVGFGVRAILAIAVMFPQILLGALITFATVDIYPYYEFCGRIFPEIDAVADQQIGGLVIWLPPAMMSILSLVLVLRTMNRAERGTAGAS